MMVRLSYRAGIKRAYATLPLALLALLLMAGPLAVSWASERGTEERKVLGVIGMDGREVLPPGEALAAMIGRIELHPAKSRPGAAQGLVPICTGTLVGPEHVLTNAHCVLDPQGELRTEVIWFRPGYRSRRLAPTHDTHVTHVRLGTRFPAKARNRDWALLRLAKPIGEDLGWVPIADEMESFVAGSPIRRATPLVSMVAYAVDFHRGALPSLQRDCRLLGFDRRGCVRHDCDMSTGASGAPLWTMGPDQKPRIVAINAAHRAAPRFAIARLIGDPAANIAVDVRPVKAWLQRFAW